MCISTSSSEDTGWKGPQEISSSASCTKQGQAWSHTTLAKALFTQVLKTSKDGDCTASPGSAFPARLSLPPAHSLVRAQPPTAAPRVSGSATCHNGKKPKAFLSPVDKYNSGTRGLRSYTSIDNVTDGLVVESCFKRERQGKSQVLPKNLGENVVLKNLIY